MKWSDLFSANQAPSSEDIKQYIGEGLPVWSELLSYIEEAIKCNQKCHIANVRHNQVGI